VLVVSLLSLVVGFAVAFLIRVNVTSDWTCDGPCFDKWDGVTLLATGVGCACAVMFGYLALRLLGARFDRLK
jgi:hypothetical protein